MEYASKGDLYDYISERQRLTEQEARHFFRQVVSAIYYCHKVSKQPPPMCGHWWQKAMVGSNLHSKMSLPWKAMSKWVPTKPMRG